MSSSSEHSSPRESNRDLYKRLCFSYALAAALWLVAMDWALAFAFRDGNVLAWLIPIKNSAFVLLSALGVWDFATKILSRREEEGVEIERMKERLRLFSQASHDALWLLSVSGAPPRCRIDYANPSFSQIWGRTVEEVDSMPSIFGELIHPEDALWAGPRTELFFAGKGGASLDVEFRMAQPDGSWRWVWTKAEMVFDAKGRPLRIAGVTRDLSSRKKTELALVESERLFKSLFDTSHDGIALCAAGGSFIEVNKAFSELTGYQLKELRGMSFQSLTRRGWRREEQRILEEQVHERGFSDLYEKECRRKDGSYVPVNVRVSTLQNAAGERSGMFCIVRDITEEKMQLDALRQAKDTAESAHQAQNRFLAVVSHELRTPLNPIIGYADLMLSQCEDPQQEEFLGIIKDSATGMSQLILDILDFARIESGQAVIESSPFPLSELVQVVGQRFEASAEARGNSLKISYDWKPCAVRGDQEKIRQVLSNLLSNACKFTREGSIALRCYLLRGSGENAVFRFEVSDTGPGIPAEKQEMIFQPFQRAVEGPSLGVGLGLAVAQKLVGAMGGSISLESEVGRGSAFRVDLPLPIERLGDTPVAEASSETPVTLKRGFRVLVVEDDGANLAFSRDLLTHYGCQVTTAQNGREALDRLEEARFDLVLMDVSMPVMDGFEATSRLRQSDSPNKDVPVVAMTAHAAPLAESDCRKSGMNDFLTKPISVEAFESVLRKWLQP